MISINQQDKDVSDYLKAAGIKYSVIPVMQDAIEDDWKHDKWTAIFNGVTFDYRMGTGHRIAYFGVTPDPKTRKAIKEFREVTGYTDKFPETKELRRNPNKHSIRFEDYARAVPPTQASVLYSLLLDSEAESMTFGDWCDNYGYEVDSRKAQDIYFECQRAADKLKQIFSHDQREHLSELLQDY